MSKEAEEYLENYNYPNDNNYGLFQRKSDNKNIEFSNLLEDYYQSRVAEEELKEELDVNVKIEYKSMGKFKLTPVMINSLKDEPIMMNSLKDELVETWPEEAPTMSFEDFYKTWEVESLPELRRGQTLLNCLREVWPDEEMRIASVHYYDRTDIDCYYNDDLVDNTLKHLKRIWK